MNNYSICKYSHLNLLLSFEFKRQEDTPLLLRCPLLRYFQCLRVYNMGFIPHMGNTTSITAVFPFPMNHLISD